MPPRAIGLEDESLAIQPRHENARQNNASAWTEDDVRRLT